MVLCWAFANTRSIAEQVLMGTEKRGGTLNHSFGTPTQPMISAITYLLSAIAFSTSSFWHARRTEGGALEGIMAWCYDILLSVSLKRRLIFLS